MSDKIINRLVDRADDQEVRTTRLLAEVGDLRGAVGALQRAVQAQATGQPDWLMVTDAETARSVLARAEVFVEEVLVHLGVVLPPCWRWHPLIVVEVTALAEQYKAAYDGTSVAVCDFLARWLPQWKARLKDQHGCDRHQHMLDGRAYGVDTSLLEKYAHWWATDRTGLPPGLS